MYHLDSLGLVCNLGPNSAAVAKNLLDARQPVPEPTQLLQQEAGYYVGRVDSGLPSLAAVPAQFHSRNNQLALAALEQIRHSIEQAIAEFGSGRIAVVMASSTTGIAHTEAAVAQHLSQGNYPSNYDARQGQLGNLSDFVCRLFATSGPSYTLSTACSSSANAALSARRLLAADLCDAVIFGGVDSLCAMTLRGFGALDAQSSQRCRPLSAQRDGINIGEAAAVFLMTREGSGPYLAGGAGSSDAHHISAPHPEGDGAYAAMQGAVADAGLKPEDIGYINLHGTGTQHNDAMETKAVHRLFGTQVPCSSTKAFTGHTLGAAGALELGLCWLLLTQQQPWRLPPSLYRDELDPTFPAIGIVGDTPEAKPRYCLSNSFAFGGSNVALVLGCDHD